MSLSKYTNPHIATGFQKFYLNDTLADIYFAIGSERIPSHKVVLAASSDAFKAMFSGSWKPEDIKIKNASFDSFKAFLKFFYSEEIELSMDHIEDVMTLGQMYLVTGCLDICAQFLTKNLTNDVVCFIYGLSIICDLTELKKICEVTIGLSTKVILKTAGFLECNRHVLGHILKLESLSCTETELFEACMEWVKSKSNQSVLKNDLVSTHLGDLFYEIRFGAMTPDEREKVFSLYGEVFTAEVRSKIADSIKTKTAENRPRLCSWNGTVLECSRRISHLDDKPYELKDTEIATFTTNVPLLLKAVVGDTIQEYRKYQWLQEVEEEINGELSVIEYLGDPKSDCKDMDDDDEDMDGSKRRVIYTDNVVIEETMLLAKPIIIKPGFIYEVRISDLEESGYPWCTEYKAKDGDVKVKDGIIVQFSNHSSIKNHQNGFGFIRGLQFSEFGSEQKN